MRQLNHFLDTVFVLSAVLFDGLLTDGSSAGGSGYGRGSGNRLVFLSGGMMNE